MKIIFIGPQGSGKGTQAEMLNKKLNIPYIYPGNILRENIANKTKLGKLVAEYLNNGKLAPNSVTNDLVKDRLEKDDVKNGFILDGYPRNLIQAEFLDKIAKADIVLEIYISDEEAVSRLSGRRSCKCGAIYHIKYNPPKQEGKCDKCGGALFVREDDKEDGIKERLSIYHNQTEPLLNNYKKQGILVRINGEQSIEDVHRDVLKEVGKMDLDSLVKEGLTEYKAGKTKVINSLADL
ncbi:adenylate kinase [Patescibacteria group bacterium]